MVISRVKLLNCHYIHYESLMEIARLEPGPPTVKNQSPNCLSSVTMKLHTNICTLNLGYTGTKTIYILNYAACMTEPFHDFLCFVFLLS
jgi:hypothetical protein